jgi:hypothetical protein
MLAALERDCDFGAGFQFRGGEAARQRPAVSVEDANVLLDPDLTVLSTGTHGEHAPAGGQRSGAFAPFSVDPQNRAYRVDGCDHWSEREQNDGCCQQ